MSSILNHVAFVVEEIESILEREVFAHFFVGEIESFPSEGTREVYIGRGNGRVLLMQPTGEGPYLKALNRRGSGLHHIAIDVEDTQDYLHQIKGSGWYIHPDSLSLFLDHQCLFLARPQTELLIEVQQRKSLSKEDFFVQKINLSIKRRELIERLDCAQALVGEVSQVTIDNVLLDLNCFY
jgi:hypothetical protein